MKAAGRTSARRRGGARRAAVLLAAALGVAGCARPLQSTEVALGEHRFRVILPAGWEHLEHGREHVFRNAEHRITLTELGPAGREGVLAEFEGVRRAALEGRAGDAVARFQNVLLPNSLLPDPGHRREFWQGWYEQGNALVTGDAVGKARAADRLRDLALLLESPPLDTLALAAWERIEDDRRAPARTESRDVNGREVLVIESWDRVTHAGPRRHAFFVHRGRLLDLATRAEPVPAVREAFETMLASLEVLADTTGSSGPPRVTLGQGVAGR